MSRQARRIQIDCYSISQIGYYPSSMKQRSLLIVLVLLITCTSAGSVECNFKYYPMPYNCEVSLPGAFKTIDPCEMVYDINAPEAGNSHFKELIEHYQEKTFFCHQAYVQYESSLSNSKTAADKYPIYARVLDPRLKSAFTPEEQTYSLSIDREKAQIIAETYVGFIRGLQTLTQSIRCHRRKSFFSCQLQNIPITITKDHPDFVFRGLMIDTSKHFLPVQIILETIDALMYNKMNVLHWHITGQDSFPLKLERHPELAEYGSFSEEEVYTVEQIKDIVRYAMVRGVRVVPEVVVVNAAWAFRRAPSYTEEICWVSDGKASLDITLNKTYQLLREIYQELDAVLVDPIVYIGWNGQESPCMTNKTEFFEEMSAQTNITNPFSYFISKVQKIISQINPAKTPIYWSNNESQIVTSDDLINWYGPDLPDVRNKLIRTFTQKQQSDPDSAFNLLGMGFGDRYGEQTGQFVLWMNIYSEYLFSEIYSYTNKRNVLGGVICLQSDVSNEYTHHYIIWVRASAYAEKMWNSNMPFVQPGGLKRLTSFERLMNRRGIPTHPITCQQCEITPQYCLF